MFVLVIKIKNKQNNQKKGQKTTKNIDNDFI